MPLIARRHVCIEQARLCMKACDSGTSRVQGSDRGMLLLQMTSREQALSRLLGKQSALPPCSVLSAPCFAVLSWHVHSTS